MEYIADNIPDISFIDDATIDQILAQMISDYQSKYEEVTGNKRTLAQADPDRLILYAASIQIYQAMQYADTAGKMGLLKYSREDFLDNLGALRGVSRIQAAPATCILQFSIENALTSATPIVAGCRVTSGNDVFFATDEYAEIPAGETSITVTATCTEAGTIGNDLVAGEITTLVNTLPGVSVVNISATEGGSDIESDDDLRDRIYAAANSYSVAGPTGAYEYHTKMADSTIGDVVVDSPTPGVVDVYFIKEDGDIPDEALCEKVTDYLNDRNIRPLTDQVTAKAPTAVNYNVTVTYYIAASKKSAVETIQSNINTAVTVYNNWQTEKIGRDIIPDYLIQKMMEAGAKRVEVTSPVFTIIDDSMVARVENVTITYGGLESD